MPTILSVSELQTIILPQVTRFRRCVWPILEFYRNSIAEEARLLHDATTEANALYDYMAANALREYGDGIPGAQTVTSSTLFVLLDGLPYGIDGAAACRFKQLTANGRSRNFPTQTARAVRRNDAEIVQLELGISPTVVDVGYTLNPLRTDIARVQAIRLIDEAFILEIPREESGTILMPRPLPETPSSPRFEISSREEQSGSYGPEAGEEK